MKLKLRFFRTYLKYKTPKQIKLTVLGCKIIFIKAKDTPWDAVLMGSVVCTVGANVQTLFIIFQILYYIFHFLTIFHYFNLFLTQPIQLINHCIYGFVCVVYLRFYGVYFGGFGGEIIFPLSFFRQG